MDHEVLLKHAYQRRVFLFLGDFKLLMVYTTTHQKLPLFTHALNSEL